MPEAAANSYKADLRAIQFTLYEHLKVQQLFDPEPFSHISREECDAIIDQCIRFVNEVTGPLNGPADRAGCTLRERTGDHAARLQERLEEALRARPAWASRCRSTTAASAARTRSPSCWRSCRAAPTAPSTCTPA